jgi:peptide-methionine (S)-S-oxide reductase
VGYAGGTKENPTYRSLGDHAETIQIDYDPTIISYDKLLDIFWASHNPEKLSWSRQYMSAIFFQNDMQKKLAMETRDREAVRIKGKIFTEIAHFTRFYMAEAYHQKYYLQQEPELMNEFRIIYPAAGDFVASTAAARVNGYVGGYGTFAALQAEMSSLGLSPEGSKELMDIVNAFGY